MTPDEKRKDCGQELINKYLNPTVEPLLEKIWFIFMFTVFSFSLFCIYFTREVPRVCFKRVLLWTLLCTDLVKVPFFFLSNVLFIFLFFGSAFPEQVLTGRSLQSSAVAVDPPLFETCWRCVSFSFVSVALRSQRTTCRRWRRPWWLSVQRGCSTKPARSSSRTVPSKIPRRGRGLKLSKCDRVIQTLQLQLLEDTRVFQRGFWQSCWWWDQVGVG